MISILVVSKKERCLWQTNILHLKTVTDRAFYWMLVPLQYYAMKSRRRLSAFM